KRTLTRCLLFAAHPLLALLGPEDFLAAAEEEDATPPARPASTCPYLQSQKKPRGPNVRGAFIEAATPLENLDKLERAERMVQEAESYRRRGHSEEAISLYGAIRTLCPGSRYDEMASNGLRALRTGQATGEAAAETGPEVLRRRLQSPVTLAVTDMPLARVLDELRVLVPDGLSIKVDQSAIEAAGLELRQPVTVKVEQVSVERVLRLILRRTNLGYR